MAAGVADAVFWASTPREVGALLDALRERETEAERRATLRAALVASEVHNAHRADSSGRRIMYGRRPVQPRDYLQESDVQILDPKEMREVLSSWAESHNKGTPEA